MQVPNGGDDLNWRDGSVKQGGNSMSHPPPSKHTLNRPRICLPSLSDVLLATQFAYVKEIAEEWEGWMRVFLSDN